MVCFTACPRQYLSIILPSGWRPFRTVFDVPKKRPRLAELRQRLEEPDLWKDRELASGVQREYAELERALKEFSAVENVLKSLREAEELLQAEPDPELQASLETDRAAVALRIANLERSTYFSGEHDNQPALVTISAGAGGTDAQDWAAMLLRMYLRYGESKGWQAEIIDESRGAEAGYKHVTVRFGGVHVYGHLKHEAGVHRLVRLSPFNADHLRQTSFALVDVIPEIDPGTVKIRPEDIAFEAFRSSGKGGQNVQKVSTAVRLKHLPTGVVVTCQTERSQLQNRERAFAVLVSKLEHLREEQAAATLADLRGDVPEAAWGRQIRSYVLHPYKQVKDHRTGHETPDAEDVLDGALDPFIDAHLKASGSVG